MKLIVTAIADHSAKANLVTYEFINTSTILDGCKVSGFAPKSVTLVQGIEQDVPYFVANGIFRFNYQRNVKSLEKQLQAKAPKGQKRVWRAQAAELLSEVAKLNVEVEVEEEPTGEFIGTPGETITFITKNIVCVHTRDWVNQFGWRHTGYGWERPHGTCYMWRIEDTDGNIYMFSSSGVKTNTILENAEAGAIFQAVVDEHKVYHNVRQTWVRKIKKNPGLFQLLG